MDIVVTNMVTSLGLGTHTRYSLHEVFRSLPWVPDEFFLYLELKHADPVSFRVRVHSVDGRSSYQTELFGLKASLSGSSEWAAALPGGVAGLLPGRYTVEVVADGQVDALSTRAVFFGEM